MRAKGQRIVCIALGHFLLACRKNRIELNTKQLTPQESFSGVSSLPHAPGHHTWGCFIFVLEDANHSGLGTFKLEPHSRVDVYLGHSPYHAGNVALVLNLKTGHCSPQFHVIFDDDFSTVSYLDSSTPPPNWHTPASNSRKCATAEQFRLATSWNTAPNLPTHTPAIPKASPCLPHDTTIPSSVQDPMSSEDSRLPPREDSLPPPREDPQHPVARSLSHDFLDLSNAGLRRSTRRHSPIDRLTYRCLAMIHVIFDDDFSTVSYLDSSTPPPNWHTLASNSRECATAEQFRLASSWNTAPNLPTHTPAIPTASSCLLHDTTIPSYV